MNGLKFIRTRCNYSQAALAEMLNVSRQAINMWETSKKPIPEPRRTEICEIFGIENPAWLDEIDEKTANEIIESVMYKVVDETGDDSSEHFIFKPVSKYKVNIGIHDKELSLDEICALKRIEIKNLLNEIQLYSEGVGERNSYGRLGRMNTTNKAFLGLLEAVKTCNEKSAAEKMFFIHIVFGVIDALNLAFKTITVDDLKNSSDPRADFYYTVPLSTELADVINKYIDNKLPDLQKHNEIIKAQIKAGEINPIPTTNP